MTPGSSASCSSHRRVVALTIASLAAVTGSYSGAASCGDVVGEPPAHRRQRRGKRRRRRRDGAATAAINAVGRDTHDSRAAQGARAGRPQRAQRPHRLPLAVLRNIPRPAAAAAFDLEALALKLWVTTLATADRREAVRVEVPSGTVPDALAHAIAHRLDELWKKKLAKGGERAGWMLESEISLQPPFSPHLSHSAPHVTR